MALLSEANVRSSVRTLDGCTGLMKGTAKQALLPVFSPLILTTLTGQTMPHCIEGGPGRGAGARAQLTWLVERGAHVQTATLSSQTVLNLGVGGVTRDLTIQQ